MSKLSRSSSNPSGRPSVSSDPSEIARMSRLAILGSVLLITPACGPKSLPTQPVTTPVVAVPTVAPGQLQPLEDFTEPEPKAVDQCAKNAEVTPDAKKQDLDEHFFSARDPKLALSDFYKKPFNAMLYNFSYIFSASRSKAVYLGLLECESGYEGKRYLSHPDKLQVFQQMRAYYLSTYHLSVPDPALLGAIDNRIADSKNSR